MKSLHRSLLIAVSLVLTLGASPEIQAPDGGSVVICPVNAEGMIDEGVAVVVERAVQSSRSAKAVVFKIDTFGGRVDSAMKIADIIRACPAQTIAYIEGKGAISAGALIAFACKDIIMQPGSNMGAAAPVLLTPEGMLPTGEKEVSYMRAKMRALAELNGHNPDIAQAMVDKDVELWAFTAPDGRKTVFAAPPTEPTPTQHETSNDPIDPLVDQLSRELDIPGQTGESIKRALRGVIKTPVELDKSPEAYRVSQSPSPPLANAVPNSELILPKGKLLTLTTKEAIEYGVVPVSAETLDAALAYYHLDSLERIYIRMTWAEQIFRFLTNPTVSGILLLLGIGGLYIEVRTPGFGVPGIVGIVCLALFFGARAILGLADWIDLLFILAGVGLLALEIFVTPGFGLPGIGGIACILIGIVLSFTMNDFTIPKYSWEFERLNDALVALGIALVALPIFVLATWKLFAYTSAHRNLVLSYAEEETEGYVVQTADTEKLALGLTGKSESMLRPTGRGRFRGKVYPVVTRGDFIEQGERIVIVQVEGNRYVVEKTPEEKA